MRVLAAVAGAALEATSAPAVGMAAETGFTLFGIPLVGIGVIAAVVGLGTSPPRSRGMP